MRRKRRGNKRRRSIGYKKPKGRRLKAYGSERGGKRL